MAQHIGIVGCSAPGAALCYETICMEGAALIGESQTPLQVSLHSHPFSEYMRHIEDDDWKAVMQWGYAALNFRSCYARKIQYCHYWIQQKYWPERH